ALQVGHEFRDGVGENSRRQREDEDHGDERSPTHLSRREPVAAGKETVEPLFETLPHALEDIFLWRFFLEFFAALNRFKPRLLLLLALTTSNCFLFSQFLEPIFESAQPFRHSCQ